jgi:TonB family protein
MGKNCRLGLCVAVAAFSISVLPASSLWESARTSPRIASQEKDVPEEHMSSGPVGLQESGRPDQRTGFVELGEVKPPKLIKAVTPLYPLNARRLGFEGVVIIEATTDLKGRVAKTKVLKSVPFLDQAAVKAIKQWVYEPFVINGRPRAIVFTVSIRFSLSYGGKDKALADLEPPKLLTRVVPVYPDKAKKAGIEGTVVLGATIDGNGQVTEVKVLDSVPGLDQAAVDAVKQWRYTAVWVGNQPVIYTFTVTVRFALK